MHIGCVHPVIEYTTNMIKDRDQSMLAMSISPCLGYIFASSSYIFDQLFVSLGY